MQQSAEEEAQAQIKEERIGFELENGKLEGEGGREMEKRN